MIDYTRWITQPKLCPRFLVGRHFGSKCNPRILATELYYIQLSDFGSKRHFGSKCRTRENRGHENHRDRYTVIHLV